MSRIIVLEDTQTIMSTLSETGETSGVDLVVEQEIPFEFNGFDYTLIVFENSDLILVNKAVGSDYQYRLYYNPLGGQELREDFPIPEVLTEDGFADKFTIVQEDDTVIEFIQKHDLLVGTDPDNDPVFLKEYYTEQDQNNPELLIFEINELITVFQGCDVEEDVDFTILS